MTTFVSARDFAAANDRRGGETDSSGDGARVFACQRCRTMVSLLPPALSRFQVAAARPVAQGTLSFSDKEEEMLTAEAPADVVSTHSAAPSCCSTSSSCSADENDANAELSEKDLADWFAAMRDPSAGPHTGNAANSGDREKDAGNAQHRQRRDPNNGTAAAEMVNAIQVVGSSPFLHLRRSRGDALGSGLSVLHGDLGSARGLPLCCACVTELLEERQRTAARLSGEVAVLERELEELLRTYARDGAAREGSNTAPGAGAGAAAAAPHTSVEGDHSSAWISADDAAALLFADERCEALLRPAEGNDVFSSTTCGGGGGGVFTGLVASVSGDSTDGMEPDDSDDEKEEAELQAMREENTALRDALESLRAERSRCMAQVECQLARSNAAAVTRARTTDDDRRAQRAACRDARASLRWLRRTPADALAFPQHVCAAHDCPGSTGGLRIGAVGDAPRVTPAVAAPATERGGSDADETDETRATGGSGTFASAWWWEDDGGCACQRSGGEMLHQRRSAGEGKNSGTCTSSDSGGSSSSDTFSSCSDSTSGDSGSSSSSSSSSDEEEDSQEKDHNRHGNNTPCAVDTNRVQSGSKEAPPGTQREGRKYRKQRLPPCAGEVQAAVDAYMQRCLAPYCWSPPPPAAFSAAIATALGATTTTASAAALPALPLASLFAPPPITRAEVNAACARVLEHVHYLAMVHGYHFRAVALHPGVSTTSIAVAAAPLTAAETDASVSRAMRHGVRRRWSARDVAFAAPEGGRGADTSSGASSGKSRQTAASADDLSKAVVAVTRGNGEAAGGSPRPSKTRSTYQQRVGSILGLGRGSAKSSVNANAVQDDNNSSSNSTNNARAKPPSPPPSPISPEAAAKAAVFGPPWLMALNNARPVAARLSLALSDGLLSPLLDLWPSFGPAWVALLGAVGELVQLILGKFVLCYSRWQRALEEGRTGNHRHCHCRRGDGGGSTEGDVGVKDHDKHADTTAAAKTGEHPGKRLAFSDDADASQPTEQCQNTGHRQRRQRHSSAATPWPAPAAPDFFLDHKEKNDRQASAMGLAHLQGSPATAKARVDQTSSQTSCAHKQRQRQRQQQRRRNRNQPPLPCIAHVGNPPCDIRDGCIDGFDIDSGSAPPGQWAMAVKKLMATVTWCSRATAALEIDDARLVEWERNIKE